MSVNVSSETLWEFEGLRLVRMLVDGEPSALRFEGDLMDGRPLTLTDGMAGDLAAALDPVPPDGLNVAERWRVLSEIREGVEALKGDVAGAATLSSTGRTTRATTRRRCGWRPTGSTRSRCAPRTW